MEETEKNRHCFQSKNPSQSRNNNSFSLLSVSSIKIKNTAKKEAGLMLTVASKDEFPSMGSQRILSLH